jgi:hypothetical protein
MHVKNVDFTVILLVHSIIIIVNNVHFLQSKAMERLGRNEINFSIKSRMMDMRKAVNHPYLIDYPVMEDGMYFRYNIQLQCCELPDPGSGAFLTPGWIKKIKIWIWDVHPGSYFLELRNSFVG